jgi:hypothetical protein
LTEYFTIRKPELLKQIIKQGALSDALTAELRAAADQFKETWE